MAATVRVESAVPTPKRKPRSKAVKEAVAKPVRAAAKRTRAVGKAACSPLAKHSETYDEGVIPLRRARAKKVVKAVAEVATTTVAAFDATLWDMVVELTPEAGQKRAEAVEAGTVHGLDQSRLTMMTEFLKTASIALPSIATAQAVMVEYVPGSGWFVTVLGASVIGHAVYNAIAKNKTKFEALFAAMGRLAKAILAACGIYQIRRKIEIPVEATGLFASFKKPGIRTEEKIIAVTPFG